MGNMSPLDKVGMSLNVSGWHQLVNRSLYQLQRKMQYDQSTGVIYLFDTDSLTLKTILGGTANPWAISPQWLRINIGDVQVFCRSEILWGEGEGGNIGGSLIVIVIWLSATQTFLEFSPLPKLNWRWSNLTSIFFSGGWNHQLLIWFTFRFVDSNMGVYRCEESIRRLFVLWWNWIQWYWVLQSSYMH